MEEVIEKKNDDKQNEAKKNNKKYWFAFGAAQVLFVIVSLFGGPKLSILSAILGIASVFLLGVAIVDTIKSSRLFRILMLLFIVIQCGIYFLIKSLFTGILIVQDYTNYKTIWTKSSYYVTTNNDTISLERNSFYVDNQTDRTLEIYTVHYKKSTETFGGGTSINDVIEPHTVTKVSQKPRYIFKTPPSTVISRKRFTKEKRTAIRFQ